MRAADRGHRQARRALFAAGAGHARAVLSRSGPRLHAVLQAGHGLADRADQRRRLPRVPPGAGVGVQLPGVLVQVPVQTAHRRPRTDL